MGRYGYQVYNSHAHNFVLYFKICTMTRYHVYISILLNVGVRGVFFLFFFSQSLLMQVVAVVM